MALALVCTHIAKLCSFLNWELCAQRRHGIQLLLWAGWCWYQAAA